MDGVGNGVPAFTGDGDQREHGELGGEHREKASHRAAQTCPIYRTGGALSETPAQKYTQRTDWEWSVSSLK